MPLKGYVYSNSCIEILSVITCPVPEVNAYASNEPNIVHHI